MTTSLSRRYWCVVHVVVHSLGLAGLLAVVLVPSSIFLFFTGDALCPTFSLFLLLRVRICLIDSLLS